MMTTACVCSRSPGSVQAHLPEPRPPPAALHICGETSDVNTHPGGLQPALSAALTRETPFRVACMHNMAIPLQKPERLLFFFFFISFTCSAKTCLVTRMKLHGAFLAPLWSSCMSVTGGACSASAGKERRSLSLVRNDAQ